MPSAPPLARQTIKLVRLPSPVPAGIAPRIRYPVLCAVSGQALQPSVAKYRGRATDVRIAHLPFFCNHPFVSCNSNIAKELVLLSLRESGYRTRKSKLPWASLSAVFAASQVKPGTQRLNSRFTRAGDSPGYGYLWCRPVTRFFRRLSPPGCGKQPLLSSRAAAANPLPHAYAENVPIIAPPQKYLLQRISRCGIQVLKRRKEEHDRSQPRRNLMED